MHAVGGQPFQVRALAAEHRGTAAELLLSEQASLDGLGQLDLVLGGQQRDMADLAQVDPHQVTGRGRAMTAVRLFGADVRFLNRDVIRRRVQHLDSLIGEDAHDPVQGVSAKLGPVYRRGDVPERHRTPGAPERHEVGHLLC